MKENVTYEIKKMVNNVTDDEGKKSSQLIDVFIPVDPEEDTIFFCVHTIMTNKGPVKLGPAVIDAETIEEAFAAYDKQADIMTKVFIQQANAPKIQIAKGFDNGGRLP